MSQQRRWRKLAVKGQQVGVAAVYSKGKPALQVTIIKDPREPVASITRFWEMETIQAALLIVNEITEQDVQLHLNVMQEDVNIATKVNGFLSSYKPKPKEPEWKKLRNAKR